MLVGKPPLIILKFKSISALLQRDVLEDVDFIIQCLGGIIIPLEV